MASSKTRTRNTQTSKRKFLDIKSIGLVNGEFAVILEDGSWLGGVQSVDIKKSVDDLGNADIKVILPYQ